SGDTRSVSAVSFGATAGSVGSALAGTYGSLTLHADGSYSYAANTAAANALAAGQSGVDVFSYTVRDAAGATSTATLTLTVNGVNDAAVIGGTGSGSVVEAGGVANGTPGTPGTSGALTISDADAGEALFQAPASLSGTYGSFSFNAVTGAWSYALDDARAATQALTAGQIAHNTLTVKSSDGTATQIIDVTVNGSNDNASIAGTA